MSAATLQNAITLTMPIVGIIVACKFADKIGLKTLLAYLLVRAGVLVLMLSSLHAVSADLPGWYMHAKWMVEQHCFPGKDFLTPYHLGFNALIYLSVLIWNSQYSIIALYTLAEFAAMLFLFKSFRQIVGEIITKRILILYASSPVCLTAYRSTQDEPILLLGVALVLWGVLHWKPCILFLASFFAIFISKILSPLYLLPVLITKKWRGVLILCGSVVLYWLIAITIGINPFDMRFGRVLGLDDKMPDIIMGRLVYGNIWPFFPTVSTRIAEIFSLIALATTSYFCVGGFRINNFNGKTNAQLGCFYLSILSLVFVLTYPRSFYMYALPALPFVYLALLNGSGKSTILLVVVTLWQWLLVYTPGESSILMRYRFVYAAVYYPLVIFLIGHILFKYFQLIPKRAVESHHVAGILTQRSRGAEKS